jgi:predicted transposase YbfD/YdcC
MGRFRKAFRRLPDPRAENARHDLLELLVIALAAVLCGATGCAEMAEFGCAKEDLLRGFLRLEHGIPSHDTFSRVFRLLEPAAFEAAFRRFMAGFAKAHKLKLGGVVALDGKALASAFERGRSTSPLHLVNLWAVEARLALAQRKAPGRNEVAGALEVLQMLSLEGCIVTADALHCHRAMAKTILARGGDYVLAIKGNRGPLFAAVRRQLQHAGQRSTAQRLEPSTHGRREQRRAVVMRNTSLVRCHAFPGVVAVGRVTSYRRPLGQRAEPRRVRHYLLSTSISAKRLLQITRSHWTIENQLHWVLDVQFDEDGSRTRKDHAPENLATLRRLALNILRAHPYAASIRRKIKRAGWDNAFLTSLLAHMR